MFLFVVAPNGAEFFIYIFYKQVAPMELPDFTFIILKVASLDFLLHFFKY